MGKNRTTKIDLKKPGTSFDLKKEKLTPKNTENDFKESLESKVQNYLLKYETERKNTREDMAIVQGVGGDNLDGFIADISKNYELSTIDKKEDKKQKTKSDFLLKPVSELVEYDPDKK